MLVHLCLSVLLTVISLTAFICTITYKLINDDDDYYYYYNYHQHLYHYIPVITSD